VSAFEIEAVMRSAAFAPVLVLAAVLGLPGAPVLAQPREGPHPEAKAPPPQQAPRPEAKAPPPPKGKPREDKPKEKGKDDGKDKDKH
jgi:hypothetical protein